MTYRSQDATYLSPFGRFLLSLIFLVSGISKLTSWNDNIGMMVARQLPFAPLLLGGATAIEIIAGLAVFFGIYARQAATLLFLYLIPVTMIFHGFWNLMGPEQQIQAVMFLKNLAILGGLLQVVANGPGAYSVDEARERFNEKKRRDPRDRGVSGDENRKIRTG